MEHCFTIAEDSDWSVHLCVNHSAANMPSKSIISTITGYTNPGMYFVGCCNTSIGCRWHADTLIVDNEQAKIKMCTLRSLAILDALS